MTSLKQWYGRVSGSRHHYPPLHDGTTLYAVGDIHGRLDCLRRVHDVIDRDRDQSPARPCTEIYLGDYVDRGPDSKGVIDQLLRRRWSVRTVFLAGNHDLMMQAYLHGRLCFEEWRPFGGAATLLSYGLDQPGFRAAADAAAFQARIPKTHRHFLDGLGGFHIQGDYCFVHAGLRPGLAADRQSLDDLTWIRDEFLAYRGRFDHVVVHAHTPVSAADFRSNRINLDTGAYRTGHLTVLKLDQDGPRVLEA